MKVQSKLREFLRSENISLWLTLFFGLPIGVLAYIGILYFKEWFGVFALFTIIEGILLVWVVVELHRTNKEVFKDVLREIGMRAFYLLSIFVTSFLVWGLFAGFLGLIIWFIKQI